ncbi:hypothetical protein [Pseudomonas brassicacearum]|uniref:hypothetical protein n=1 Tax=Pseudomonas brassicacearum TaxID=930166 RepID=UPI0012D477C3|nr:hypothetical protein [Pseudomonas brassicacearum]
MSEAQYDDFICNSPGENSNAQCPTGLQLGHYVSINGSSDISDVIVGKSGASVKSIKLERIDGTIYNYQITVVGKGPNSGFTSSINLSFTDSTGDTYTLSIINSSVRTHTVKYNSSDAKITNIAWKND